MTGSFRTVLRGAFALCALLSSLACVAGPDDDRVVVLTSYPEELTARYLRAFESRYPGMRVELLWRQSADALLWLRGPGTGAVDVYWAPSPGNFATLKSDGRLTRLEVDKALPAKVGGEAISDPDGHYVAFELAGYGIACNVQSLRALGLPVPRDWSDLTAPGYAGRVQLPIPGRVGFAPGLIEAVLQGQGWKKGWALLSEIAGNATFGAGDATPALDDLVSGQVAARMTIDFFAAQQAAGRSSPVRFVYPPRTAYSPAHVAVLADAPHADAARRFVNFLLSAEGQDLLLHPDVRRLPVRPDRYAAHPELSARPFAADTPGFDSTLMRKRQGLVAALFDIVLVQPHAERAHLWARVHAAERDGLGDTAAVREARTLLGSMPVDAVYQVDAPLRRLFEPVPRTPGEADTPPSRERRDTEARWREAVARALARAGGLLDGQGVPR
ncbi:ABC transporter substrate-binding protein [Methyloversatilis thermotolerans]|uniref:ABC transporter substrate-binding protein n=1 Tax=Methyloversatilis thermotolerans TaxID=1346290 RepID=UPI00037C1C46|nr:extracellular solute-binding protein [Methyloversatilis thermotolerans]